LLGTPYLISGKTIYKKEMQSMSQNSHILNVDTSGSTNTLNNRVAASEPDPANASGDPFQVVFGKMRGDSSEAEVDELAIVQQPKVSLGPDGRPILCDMCGSTTRTRCGRLGCV
jgi:hypothetical protein